MLQKHLDILVDPLNKRPLSLKDAKISKNRVERGTLVEAVSGNQYPIIDFIPRFVESDNTDGGFGLQWNTHYQTQYDSYSGFPVSEQRFKDETKWPHDLRGEIILEAGSGSGRFTTHALATGATVVSFDYSNAVNANYQNNGQNPNLLLVQADINQMPFRDGFFDRAFCFGVLQYTPDVHRSFIDLVQKIKPGGYVASDVYIKNFKRYVLGPKYKLRPITKRVKPEKLYGFLKGYIDFMWPFARILRRIPRVGRLINWLLLIPDYSSLMPGAADAMLKEWAYLDVFNMLGRDDQPQTPSTFYRWHKEAGLVDIEVHPGFNGVEGRARLP